MAQAGLRTLLGILEVLRPALTRPGFARLLVVFKGWVLTTGQHAVTEALVVTGVAGRLHHEAFHRFFSRGTWSPDEWGRRLFGLLLRLSREGDAVRAAIDDTLAPKKGPHVFGIGSHLDAVHSTRRQRIFCFGHCWVVLAILVRVPFSHRAWALPILLRLYRTKKECKKKKHSYRKKTQLAREMLDILVTWCGERLIEVSADSAYCNGTVTRGLSDRVVLFGAMRPDAVLTESPPQRQDHRPGRPRKRGDRMRKPEALAGDGRTCWQTCTVLLYGIQRTVHYKTCVAQWYRACGTRLLRVVVVREDQGAIGLRTFFSMDATCTVEKVLETYAGRWSIEVCFRELKQLMGFADSSARKRAAVERTAPFVALSYTMLVLWCATSMQAMKLAAPPVRPWYPHKRGLSFADVLRAGRIALGARRFLDRACDSDNLQKRRQRDRSTAQQRFKFAA